MKIFIATDISVICNDGKIYAKEKYATIFKRYYNAFGTIILFSRIEHNAEIKKDCCEITELVESIIPVSSLKKVFFNQYGKEIVEKIKECTLVVARCPSFAGYKAADCARKVGKPYLTENMGCAWDAYWNHSIVGKIIAPYMFLKMKSVVYNADYALYVTEEFLQRRYPCKNESVSASNVLIKECSQNVLEKRIQHIEEMNTNKITLLTTAAVNVRYKGQEYVIQAISKLREMGVWVEYLLIGEGDDSFLREVAKEYDVSENVVFMGRLPLKEVFETIDNVDFYIQPSLQEGLPRAVIEAMSRGCPCIGARTAGIPELLDEECIVERKSVQSICDVLMRNIDKKKMIQLAGRNFLKAESFLEENLNVKRNDYYKKILEDMMQSETY